MKFEIILKLFVLLLNKDTALSEIGGATLHGPGYTQQALVNCSFEMSFTESHIG